MELRHRSLFNVSLHVFYPPLAPFSTSSITAPRPRFSASSITAPRPRRVGHAATGFYCATPSRCSRVAPRPRVAASSRTANSRVRL
ncbi:hypothetical protein CpipJ_CPIJ015763 [Culex quinquefasciatus]|uniref:Uncharacterized protein n=1 Tax=Culex quinquefasciatus TaxID=7176 RepID=B0XAU5_CULQU|nr:hypothetical protein CpipJ_CPIJ015763 [Culex quinquefasciatus]|eukprot:XP_001866767.1 hypothetical protein CpipJ_CPIJ015763 [Culex quinquefasciatus]